jgi:hypothetical protein
LSGFSAANVVNALDYDFMPFVNESGTVREPNDQLITNYIAGYKALVNEIKQKVPTLDENAGQADVLAALEDLDPEIMMSVNQKMAEIYSDLCSGKPSKTTIMALPPRIRNIFFAWLQGEVMDPEVVTGGGKKQESTQPR